MAAVYDLSEPQAVSEPPSPASWSTDILAPARQEFIALKQDQAVPITKILFPPRTSSLRPPPDPLLAGAGDCEEPDRLAAIFEQIQLSRMFQKGKQKVAAIFSPKARPARHSNTPAINADLSPNTFDQERASLTPVSGRKNKFWLQPPSQKSKDRVEKKMQRRMSPRSRERRSVTAESGRKMLELEEERIDVRDFQQEHDEAKVAELKAEMEEENAKEATVPSETSDDPAAQTLEELD